MQTQANTKLTTAPDGAPSCFAVQRLTGTLGAEISGIDLRQPIAPKAQRELESALVTHKVLFFRNQPISVDQHVDFARGFGELEIHPFTEGSSNYINVRPEVFRLESIGDKPAKADSWHSDVTWRSTPSMASVLRCRVTPAFGGDTLWADMEAAFEGLDDATRSRISGMTAIHDWHAFRAMLERNGASPERIAELQAQFPPTEHPVVRTHPVSGRKGLYVNSSFTVAIKGMQENESQELLARLYRQASIPDYQVRFKWREDSIAMWDNRSTQHYAVLDYMPQHRLMERVTIAGDKPF